MATIPQELTAQTTVSDSLLQLLTTVSEPTERGELYLQLSEATSASDAAQSLTYASRAVEMAEAAPTSDLYVRTMRRRSRLRQRLGDYEGALTDFKVLLTTVRKGDDRALVGTVLNDFAVLEKARGSYLTAGNMLRESLQISRSQRDTAGIANAMSNLAGVANRQGQNDLAISYLDTVLLLDSLQGSWAYFSQGLGNLALMRSMQKKTSKALAYALRGLAASEKYDDLAGKYLNTLVISHVYRDLRDFKPALHYAHRSLGYARERQQSNLIGQALAELQTLHQIREQHDSVVHYFTAAEPYVPPATRSSRYNNYGSYFKNSRADTLTARHWYQQALDAAVALDDGPGTYLPLVNLAIVAAAREEWPAARNYLRRAAPYRSMDFNLEAPALTTMGRVYQETGAPDEAAAHFLRALNLQEELVARHDSTRSLVTDYERQLTELTEARQAERLAAADGQLRVRNRFLAAAAFLLLLLSLAVWLAVRRGRKLAQANVQLENLREEIHHRVRNDFQSVASMFFLHLNELEDDALRTTLNGVYDRVRGLGQVHALLQENQGSTTDLDAYLHALATKRLAALSTAPAVRLDYAYELPAGASDRFSELQVRQLGIVINELITNAGKYAFPGHPDPVLRLRAVAAPDGTIAFSVADNGRPDLTNDNHQSSTSFGSRMITTVCTALGWSVATDHHTAGHSVTINTNIKA